MFERGIYEKAVPQAEKIRWRGAVQGIEWGGGLAGGRGMGWKKKHPTPGDWPGQGGELGQGPAGFWAPGAP